jgi:hypothetical protein
MTRTGADHHGLNLKKIGVNRLYPRYPRSIDTSFATNINTPTQYM